MIAYCEQANQSSGPCKLRLTFGQLDGKTMMWPGVTKLAASSRMI